MTYKFLDLDGLKHFLQQFVSKLKTVAFSGSYNDLSDKPSSLPANGGNSDTVDGKHATDLQNYNNLSNKPTIVNNGTTTAANTILDGRMGKTLADKDANLQSQITTINSALVEDEKYLNNHASNNKITDLLAINPDGNYGSDYMKPGCIGTEDASQITNCPISQGAFYAWREVLFIPNDNSRYGGKHIVRLTEAYPLSGRIWIISYNTDTSTWDDQWQCHDPQKQTIAASGNIKFTSAGGQSYGYIELPAGCQMLNVYMQEVPGNVGLKVKGFNQNDGNNSYTIWLDFDINDNVFLHWVYTKL